MALGRIAVRDIASVNTNEALHTFSEASTADLLVCNRTGGQVQIRVAVIDGALGDLADGDYVYYDLRLEGNTSQPLFAKEAFASGETVMVRSNTLDVNFRLSGRGA